MNDNRRIAKNSLILYIRLIITTIIGLYTSRIVLLELGASDYGLYAVVGGIVSMMNFLSTTMLATTYRFIAVEIGKGPEGNPNKIFNTSLIIHAGLAVILILIGETLGIWYIHNYLNIMPNKLADAIFVLHFSILATVFSILTIPYQGLVTANEQFLARAGIEIMKAILKLGFIIMLIYYIGNKLRAYAVIMALLMIFPLVFFYLYNRIKNYKIIKWYFNKKKKDYYEMLQFSSWVLIGAIAHLGVREGAALIINLFFGTILNAAFGMASQVYNYIQMFVNNLTQAAVPQIMKSHSGGDKDRSLSLVYSISKYAFFVMLILAVPVLLSVDTILTLWLKKVPEYTKEFTILMIINGLIGSSGSGFAAVIQATGKIRKAQIWYSIILLSTLPVAYIIFGLNYPPYFISIITIGATITLRLIMMKILTEITDFKISLYLSKTIYPILIVTILTLPQFLLRSLFGQNILSIIIFSIISVSIILITIYFAGLTNHERLIVKSQIVRLITDQFK